MNESVTINDDNNNMRAGFWARFAAIWIDSFLIFIVTLCIIILGRFFNEYIPFELTFIILALFYSVIFLGWRGHTPGKLICGLNVQKKNGLPIGYLTSFVREFIGKFTVAIILPSGIAWIILSRSGKEKLIPVLDVIFMILILIIFLIQYLITKRTWYDYISRTIVLQNIKLRNRTRLIISLIIVTGAVLIGIKVIQFISLFNVVNEMSSYATAKTEYQDRDSSSLLEISSLTQAQDWEYGQWLNQNGKSPVDYAIEKALQHQIVIFGEYHFIQR